MKGLAWNFHFENRSTENWRNFSDAKEKKKKRDRLDGQCDRIVRIFAQGSNVFFGQFFYIADVVRFSAEKNPCINVDNSTAWAMYTLGDLFTKSSGHPDWT
jgi:hypothetical protein